MAFIRATVLYLTLGLAAASATPGLAADLAATPSAPFVTSTASGPVTRSPSEPTFQPDETESPDSNGSARSDVSSRGDHRPRIAGPVATILQPIVAAKSASGIALEVPVRRQRDGSAFAESNCGVASLAMILAGHGTDRPVATLRAQANEIQPPQTTMDGLAWETLAGVAKQYGLRTSGLYENGMYREWTLDELRAELQAGRPIITLVDYRSLPVNARSVADTGHYIVLTGFDGDDFFYNDSLPYTGDGLGYRVSGAALLAAQDLSWPRRSATALYSPALEEAAASARWVTPDTLAGDGLHPKVIAAAVPAPAPANEPVAPAVTIRDSLAPKTLVAPAVTLLDPDLPEAPAPSAGPAPAVAPSAGPRLTVAPNAGAWVTGLLLTITALGAAVRQHRDLSDSARRLCYTATTRGLRP